MMRTACLLSAMICMICISASCSSDDGSGGEDSDAGGAPDAGQTVPVDSGAEPTDATPDAPPPDTGVDGAASVDAALPGDCRSGVMDGDEEGVDCGGSCTVACSTSYPCDAQSAIPARECWVLLALYNSNGGEGWVQNTNWLAGDPCTWWNVVCTDGHVNGLFFDDQNLVGRLPSGLSNLRALSQLWLRGNQLEGEVPAELMSLPVLLHLRLRGNRCLTASGDEFVAWLRTMDPSWNDGC